MKRILSFLLIAYLTTVLAYGTYYSSKEGTTYSAVAAQSIDQVLPSKKMPFNERMVRGFKARLISLFVYPVYAVADISYLLPKAAIELLSSTLSSQPKKTELYEASSQDIWLARRSILGFLSTPVTVISADFVTRHFLPSIEQEGVIRSGGRYYSAMGQELYPRSYEEVQELVVYATENDRHINIKGSGLSQGMQFLPSDPDDLVLNLGYLKGVDVLPETKTAVVQAGATWADVQKAINPHGLAVKVMQASNVFSLGGSISVNCHGWDHRNGAIGSTIRKLTIVNAEGKQEVLTPSDAKFHLVVGGYGLSGVVLEAEIELTDNHMLIDQGEEVSIDDYVAYFYNQVMPNQDIEMHLYRLSLEPQALLSEGMAQNYYRDSSFENNVVSNLVDEEERGERIERIGVHSARKFSTFRKAFWNREKQRILTPVSLSRNEAMRAPIHAMFNPSKHDREWLQEFFLHKETLPQFIKELGELLNQYDVCLINASVRFVKQEPSGVLGYAKEGDRFAVVLCFNQPLDQYEIDHTREWVVRAIDLSIKHKGTFYLPYQHFAKPDQLKQAYPALNEWMEMKRATDPNEVFSSQFYTYYKELFGNQVKEKLVVENAVDALELLHNHYEVRREFRKFFRNIFLNLNEDGFLKLADKVMKENRDHESIYKAFEENIGQAQPNGAVGFYRSFKALVNQREALTKQIETLMGKGTPVNGYVEIGFPGRLISAVKKTVDLSGNVIVVNDKESLSDYLQCGFPRPYDAFVTLENYAPLTKALDRNSTDLVSCFIGLHHCPKEKLEAFVQSVSDVLRPGGSFILRDHDTSSPEILAMAYLAHTTFNLGTGVAWEDPSLGFDEKTEIRNFQSLEFWDALMERHGLVRSKEISPLVRPGDPTKNSLVRYVKKTPSLACLGPVCSEEGVRPQLQTFMTSVEWHSVRTAKDYAAFIEHTPFYMYPYFSQIKSFWKVIGQSWSEARRYHSRTEILTSDYFFMNLFIAFFHTVEFFFKGLISAPVAAFYQSDANLEPETISVSLNDPSEEIAQFADKGIEVVKREASQVEVRMPRYMKFRDLMYDLAKTEVSPLFIAGQSRVQLHCTVPKELIENIETLSGCRKIGQLMMPNLKGKEIVYLNAEVPELFTVIRSLDSLGIPIDYIHDF